MHKSKRVVCLPLARGPLRCTPHCDDDQLWHNSIERLLIGTQDSLPLCVLFANLINNHQYNIATCKTPRHFFAKRTHVCNLIKTRLKLIEQLAPRSTCVLWYKSTTANAKWERKYSARRVPIEFRVCWPPFSVDSVATQITNVILVLQLRRNDLHTFFSTKCDQRVFYVCFLFIFTWIWMFWVLCVWKVKFIRCVNIYERKQIVNCVKVHCTCKYSGFLLLL